MATRSPPAPTRQDTRLVDRLIAEGKIDATFRDAVLNHMRLTGERQEESIIESSAMTEHELLKCLAAHYQTRFVSTDRLAKANIDKATLAKVPKKLAEQYGVVPVLFDADGSVLSVVTADPENLELLDQVQKIARVKVVKALVARPAAVRAAIEKLYYGDGSAFVTLERSQPESGSRLEVFGRDTHTPLPPSTAVDVGRAPWVAEARTMYAHDRVTSTPSRMTIPPANLPREFQDDRRDTRRADPAGLSSDTLRVFAAGEVPIADSYLEMVNVFVGFIENVRPDLKAHSTSVSRIVRRFSERLSLTKAEISAYVLAALVHDLGKMGGYHLTALNVALYDQHRATALKSYQNPRRALEVAGISQLALAAVESMYERFDGQGMPGVRSGRDIPVGGRILAIADVYCDLTQNTRNAYRKTLRSHDACEVLAKYKGAVFDPQFVELFRGTVVGDDGRDHEGGRALRNVVLVVDPDPEDTALLEVRLAEEGFDVRIARNAEQALSLLHEGDIDLVVSELDIGREDGLVLLEEARGAPWGKRLPWLVLTRRQGKAETQRAFDQQVVDYVLKPAATDLLIAKMKQAIDKRRGEKGVDVPSGG